jgi:hypothetical protein
MLKEFLVNRLGKVSQADYVEYGYGQVEPNHLSAQRTAQIYAQLPADPAINVLEQGQFVKYDYAKGLVNFTGEGEWMLVYNEIKLYREHQLDCEFAMIKGNYQARVYSPLDGGKEVEGGKDAEEMYGPTRLLQGKREKWDPTNEEAVDGFVAMKEIANPETGAVADYSVASTVHDYYEMNDINDPWIEDAARKRLFMKLRAVKHPEKMMPEGTTMVPRVFKTNVGDIFTTNTIGETTLKVGDTLSPRAEDGILSINGDHTMEWQVVKLYTMPDFQKGAKIMRIK